jgi:3-oxoacyl-[acyl-carrier-protein] synthase-3
MWAAIQAIEYFLPERVLTNAELALLSDAWTADKIRANTGVESRRIADPGQTASDLAVEACSKLFRSGACTANEVDYLIYCTQSPDYFLPTTACILQHRLGLRNAVGALDLNLGCSGFVYGLGLAKGLIETGQSRKVLLVTSETLSRYLPQDDLGVRVLFGDGAAATLVGAVPATESDVPPIGRPLYGSDGGGAEHLIVRKGAMRAKVGGNGSGDITSGQNGSAAVLSMNGPEIFAFTLKVVPELLDRVLEQSGNSKEDVRWFVFHQANGFLLEHLRKKVSVPKDRFCVAMSHSGNTTSSTIPIALRELMTRGELVSEDRVMLLGFGVGLSWSGAMLRWVAQEPRQ